MARRPVRQFLHQPGERIGTTGEVAPGKEGEGPKDIGVPELTELGELSRCRRKHLF